jgi:hypothetical protein
MPQRFHDLCRSRDDYRQLWAERFGIHNDPQPADADLPACIHRRELTATRSTPVGSLAVYACTKHGETTGPECDVCPDRDTTFPGGRTSPGVEDFLPIVGKGPRIREWAVGMVTAPREKETFAHSIATLIAAGWDQPRIFAEPGSPIPEEFGHLPMTPREQAMRAWPNYYYGLIELLDRHPTADAFMIAQDDVLFWPGDDRWTLREYLERALWPEEEPGFVSLYCSSAYHREQAGWHRLDRPWVWGACAIVWPRPSLADFLSSTAADWTRQGQTHKIDVAIGRWQSDRSRSAWFSSPSLAQHVGSTTTVWRRPQTLTGKRRERQFLGDMV